jgi:uridine kinase
MPGCGCTQGYDGILVVGLAGPSGAGKTVFSTKVRSFLPGTCQLQMDMFNDGTKVVDNNFDDPRLTDYETLLANIADLRAGKSVQVTTSSYPVAI